MKTLIFTVLFALSWTAHATIYKISSGQSATTIQSTIDGAFAGDAVVFSGGTYTLTSALTLKCGVTYTGPVTTAATAEITTTTANIHLMQMSGGCTSGTTTIEYLHFNGAGALYFDANNYSNINILHNQVTSIPSEQTCSAICEAGAYFDGYSGSTIQNITIEYNTFGDNNSCTAGIAVNDNDGNCVGVIFDTVQPMILNNVIIRYNTFYHLQEGIHALPTPYISPGTGPGAYGNNVFIEYNYFYQIHRIQVEWQIGVYNNPTYERYNVMGPPINSSSNDGMYAYSDACCQNGMIQSGGTNTYLDADSNIIYDNSSLSSTTNGISFAFEAWGNGTQYVHNLIQGYVCGGLEWGFGGTNNVGSYWLISNNTMQGSIMYNGTPCPLYTPLSGAFIANEFGQSPTLAPTTSGNVEQSTPTSFISMAPTISPSGGSQTYPLTVRFTDPGYTSGTIPLGNTGIWYTTDGSTPVPGSGTTRYLPNGGTFVLPAAATVKAVGMWGTPNQPTSYPSGYGYVPSPVISAVFKNGSGASLVSAYLVPDGGVKSIPVGKTLQFIAHGVYSDGTSSVLPDSEGNVVTAWNTSDHAVAKISTLGHVTAMGVGTATIEAFIGNLEASTAEVTVTPVVPTSALVSAYLVPSGGVKSIPVGRTLQFIAHGVYSDGTSAVLPDPEGNVVTAWNTSNHNIAKISSLGHVTAIAVGTATIQAFIGNLEASTSAVTVTPIVASSAQPAAIESPLAPRIESPSSPVPAVPGSPIGDKFFGPLWKVFTPAGGSVSISNGHLFLSVPGGTNHDTLLPSNQAVRAVQAIGDTDFDVSIKIDSKIDAGDAGTSQGLMVLSDDENFITFALTSDGTNIGLVARTVNAGVPTTVLEDTNFNQYLNPMYLRLARSGVAYMASYSTDGAHWTQATSFTDTGTFTFIGPFDSNYSNNPEQAVPVVMSVDWFNVE